MSTTTTVASSRSANPTSVRSPDYSIVNDVYSNSYESIRNVRNEHVETNSKTDVAEVEGDWQWSASCKDLAERGGEHAVGGEGENKVYSSSYPGDDAVDMVDSQEDVSHDSYEVLDDGTDSRRTRSALSTDNRSRSCSWNSEKALSPVDSAPRENGYRSLERRQASKQQSTEFRSLDRRKVAKTEVKKRRRSKDFDEDGVRRHPERRRSREELEVFMMDSEEELIKEEQRRRRRDRRGDREERFHEGIQERERRKQIVTDELKYERVVANHFGKYPEFMSQEELLKQEKKVIENYEKVCQVGKIAKELEESEKASKEILKPQFKEFNAKTKAGIVVGSPKLGKAPVERTKSDPYDSSSKNFRRNVLTHQKSIDITPQDSGDATSDYDNDEMARKTSKSEHDIPYTLHKRHCMNGTAKSFLTDFNAKPVKKSSFESKSPRSRSTSPGKRSTLVEIINMDESDDAVFRLGERPPIKPIKPVIGKKPVLPPSPKRATTEPAVEEALYAKVNKTPKKVPPEPPKRTSSAVKTPDPPPPDRTTSLIKSPGEGPGKKIAPEPPKRTTSVPKINNIKSPESDMSLPPTPNEPKNVSNGELREVPVKPVPTSDEVVKSVLPPLPSAVLHKREESLILFARTRLGLSEGSAFAPVTRQGHVTSPTSQRRAKSLDAPVVSLHRLPHADAFSSKDDTLDLEDEIPDKSAAAKTAEIFNVQLKKVNVAKTQEVPTNRKESSSTDNVAEIDADFKEIIETKSKDALPYLEEKVLDAVRSKRLLSKIDSVEGMESEVESSRVDLPEQRVSDLPVSVRFPSVRQMSGQTSEESDVWEEVKVKRRTPRRSTGRDEPESKESVVWDSKDEQGDDDVWDDNAVFIPDISTGIEFLKRGSCGQSIDDDNLSTPIKESSPEHWVSVDDLPEAIEREERMLREQEKILREKILHEKLKRELNLDTIEVEDQLFNQSFDDLPLPVMPSEKLKGHSLDTYELTEKKLRERCAVKNPSLDEHLFQDESLRNYLSVSQTLDISDKSSSYENVPKIPKDQLALKPPKSFVECQTIGDVKSIAQFGADEDLEEFVVVLDGDDNDSRDATWEDSSYRRSVSKEESIISVPEEFKDVLEPEGDSLMQGTVEIRLEEGLERLSCDQDDVDERISPHDSSRRSSGDPRRLSASDEPGRLSPYDGSRRSSEDPRAQIDDSGRLSPYDYSSRRTSEDPRGLMDDSGRLSPYDCSSRRSSEDPRRLSASDDQDDLRRLSMSEDSRKCSISEDSRRFSTSISEETRRRLSSTEETRRKRASLTKQCSVGVDSLSDDMIPGIQECSSSFEQDDKDVFESAPIIDVDEVRDEQEVPTPSPAEADRTVEEALPPDDGNHLVPPKGVRELSRETEDSMDYGEGDFKDIREVVKDKDISEGLVCEHESVLRLQSKLPSSFEKSESSEGDELRYIDDKRGNTPEMIVGRSTASNVISTVIVNEGISVLDQIVKDDTTRAMTLPHVPSPSGSLPEQRHTLPKMAPKPSPSTSDATHRKLTKVVPNVKLDPCGSLPDVSQDSSQDSDVDRLCTISMLSHIHSQIARRNLADTGRGLRRDSLVLVPLVTVEQENGKKLTPDEAADIQKRDSGEEVSSSSSNPPMPRRELSSTWRPFLLESSGSSSLEEGWLPPDDNAHLADEEETSSTSNQQDDSIHDDVIDYPSNVGYTGLSLSSAEMLVSGYGSVFALSRTLSRISERSTTSEQERSEEDDMTKPSSHSVSVEEESILSSDHQPSLSSDPPSPKPEPFDGDIPPPLPDNDWPSPPESSSMAGTPVVSHVETFYLEIQPEEAYKVMVADPYQGSSSSDENPTLQEEAEPLHVSSDNLSVSTTTTTQDGTVVIPVRPKSPPVTRETPVSKVRSPTTQFQFFEKPVIRSAKPEANRRKKTTSTPYYSKMIDAQEPSYFDRYDTGSLDRTKIKEGRKCYSYYSVAKFPSNEEDSSSNEAVAAANTIPRAAKKRQKRHRVAMDLQIRDGKIVAHTKACVVEGSDSDRSSPRQIRKRPAKRQSDV